MVLSTEPEAAMKFLNLLYGNEELVNLLAYGIEGEHYVKTEDGKIAYPEGIDPSISKYRGDQSYMYGNAMLTYFHETHTVQSHEEEIYWAGHGGDAFLKKPVLDIIEDFLKSLD